MSTEPVKTGIDVIGAVPWGTHFCQFYQTKEDLLDTLVPYFKAGLENNEFCMWITAEPLSAQQASRAMRRAMPDFADRLARGQIEILPHTKWYLKGGKFDQQRVLDGWVDKLNAALAAGYAGLRLTGNTFWLEKADWKSFTEYEATVNDVIGKYRMLALCTYSLDKCGAAEVMDVIRNHEFALIRREGKWEIIENAIHKQAKQAVLESERKYRQLMESLQEGVWVIDKDASTTFVNPRMAEMLGYSVDEMLGKPLFSFVDESNLSVAKERMERRRRGIKEEVEFNFRRKDGSQVWALISAAPLADVNGQFSGVIAGIVDITQRKRTEEELRRSHGLMEAVTEGTGVIMAAQDANYRYTYFNKAYQEEIKRLTGKDLRVGDNMIELFADMPEQQKVAVEEWSQTLRGETSSQRLEFGDPNRHRTTYRVFHTPIRDSKGDVVGGGEVAFDVSEQIRAAEALRQSEERYRGLYEAVAGGVVVQDKNGNIVDANEAARAILGLRLNEITGRTSMDPEWQATHEDGSPFLGDEHPAMVTLRTGEPVQGVVMGVFNPASGQRRWILINSEPLRARETGQAQAVVTTFVDITQRKQVETALRESEEKYRLLFQNMAEGFALYELLYDEEGQPVDWRVLEMNDAYTHHTGITRETILGRRMSEVYPELIPEHLPRFAEVVATQVPVEFETYSKPAGRYMHVNTFPAGGHCFASAFEDITERKKAEQSLHDALLRYRTVADNTYDFEFWINPEGQFLYASPSSQRVYGRAPAEFTDDAGLRRRIVHPDDLATFDCHVAEEASHIQSEVEFRILRPDGTFRWIAHVCQPVFDEHGRYLGVRGSNRDITERKQSQEVLRETRDYLDNLLNYANAPIIVWDPGLLITKFNRAFQNLTGYKESEVIGKRLDMLFPEESREQSLAQIGRTAAGERWEVVEIPVRRADGTVRAVLWNSANIVASDGKTTVATIAQGQDITERKQAERDLKETSDYLDNLLNHANAPIIVWDPELRITRFNRAFQRLTGHSEFEAVGQRLDMLFPKQSREESLSHIHRAMAGERWETVEIPVLRVDGEVRTVLWNSANIVASDGKTTVATIAQGQDITERKQAEHDLRETSDYLDNLLNYANAPIIVWDPELRITKFNRAFQNLTGYKESEVLGKQLDLLFPEESRDASLAHISRAAAGERWEVIEIPIRRTDGTVRTVLWNSANVRASDGVTTVATIAQGQDITERKQAEDTLRETRDYLDNLLNYANAPIIVWDSELLITKFNRAFQRLTGYSESEVLGQRLDLLFPEESREQSLAHINRALAGERWEVIEIPIQRVDGVVRTVLWNSAVIHGSNGEGPIAIIAQGQDITERKLAEKALRESEERHRLVFEAAMDGFWVTDPSGRLLQVNDSYCQMSGYTRKELLNMHISDIEAVEKPEETSEHIKRVFQQGQDRFETRHRRKDGKLIDIEVSVKYSDVRGGQLIVSARDITERKRAEEAVRTLNETLQRRAAELEVANKELESFAYSVSHDLRAPLRSIDGFSLALLEDYAGKLDDQGKDYLHRVRVASQVMGLLIDDMLELSRVSRADFHRRRVDLSGLAQEIAQELQDGEPNRCVDLVIASGLSVLGDLALLRAALENLLNNAWKFTGKCDRPKIEFGATREDGQQVYFVKDNGVGFDMNYVGKLFEPFQRLHSKDEFSGTGVGLATVRRIINRHGGRIWAEGKVGGGATFYFTLSDSLGEK